MGEILFTQAFIVILETSPGPHGQIHKEIAPTPYSSEKVDTVKFSIIMSRFNSLQLESKDTDNITSPNEMLDIKLLKSYLCIFFSSKL